MTNEIGTVTIERVRVRSGHAGGTDRKMGCTIEITGKADTCAQTEEYVKRAILSYPDLLAALEAASACLDALIEGRPILAAKVAGCTTAGNTAAEARAALAKARGSA